MLLLLVLALAATVACGVWLARSRQVAAPPDTAANGTAVPAPAQRTTPSVLFVGDSYTEGAGAGGPRHGYAWLTAAAMGWTCHLDAQGGTGFLSDGSSNSESYAPFVDRLAGDAARFYADVIIVDGGRNDGRFQVSDTLSAADTYLHELRRAWPRSAIVVVTPTYLWTTPENYAFGVGLAAGLRPVLDDIDGHLIDPVAERWIAPEQVDEFTSTDGLHPNAAGHRHLAERLTDALVREGFSDLPVVDERQTATPSAGDSAHG